MASLPSPQPKTDIIAKQIAKGMLKEASLLVEALLAAQPENPEAWHFRGVIHKKIGNADQAILCFKTALQYKPEFKEACFDLARTLEATGKLELAVKLYEHLLQVEQAHAARKPAALSAANRKKMEEWFHKGEVFQKKGDPKNAAGAFRKVLAINPDMPEALTNLGNALYYMHCYGEAEKTLLRCLHVKPWHLDALNTLGTCYRDTDYPAQAIAAYRQILAHDAGYLFAAINLGNMYVEMEHYAEAIAAHEQALVIDPGCIYVLCSLTHLLYRFCRWDEAEVAKTKLRQIIDSGQSLEPFVFTTLFASSRLQFENARHYVMHKFPVLKSYDISASLPVVARKDNKLHIGYLSSDFKEHATSRLIAELFEQHDRSRFEIYAYSYGIDDASKVRTRIISAVDRFRDIRMAADHEVRKFIEQDGIDILVDLKGHTQGHRLNLMALRPAPIQMHYLGFPGTIGASFIDYFISDAIASPEGVDAVFSECLIRLPHSYQINDRKRALPQNALSRTAYGLPAEGFVFGDFNNAYKIAPDVFAVWMRLLAQVEGSVLWVYEQYPGAIANLRREAAKRGVDPSRIIPAFPLPQQEHLQRYRYADLFLDTSPVCGHTTASDALWCGVPVVTLAGESFISRVAASLLHAVGLPELVATDLASYEALALALARDPGRLQKYRRHLEEGRMHFPLFDSMATTRALEAAYLHAARLHRNGHKPEPFAVKPELQPDTDIVVARPAPMENTVAKSAQDWFDKGNTLHMRGDLENAVIAFRKALALHPDAPEVLANLGLTLYKLHNVAKAQEVLEKAVRLKPEYPEALNTLGWVYTELGDYDKAITFYHRAIAAKPDYSDPQLNLGNIYYYTLKDYTKAIATYKQALAIDPGCIEALCNLVDLLCHFCEWNEIEAMKTKMQQMIESGRPADPFVVAILFDLPRLQLENARRFSVRSFSAIKHYNLSVPLPAVARGDNKLRIGYLSSDFKEHATSRLIAELFEQYDRSRFEIYAYSYGVDDDTGEMRRRIIGAVERFHDIRMMADHDAGKLIEQDKLDILVDLKGYTSGHRLNLMALRPAPIQMHYLGFPGTSGAPFIDYFISDGIASPEGADAMFSERLIRLPNSYQINDRKRALPQNTVPRSAYGLPEAGFVFGDFNNSYKITPEVFAVWMRLLEQIKGSVLWLYEQQTESTANLRREAEKRGIDPSRIIPALPLSQPEHLQRYRHADLFLDTSPVCGHTTTSDALWCGVPVVTLAGESFITRVAASLLNAVGLPELVTTDLAAYEALALSLARDPERLQKYRHYLEKGRMHFALFDSLVTTRALEAAYQHAAGLHRSGHKPQPFKVTPQLHIV